MGEKNRIGLLKSWGSQLAEADAPQGSTPSGGFSLAEANAAYKTAEEHKKRYIFQRRQTACRCTEQLFSAVWRSHPICRHDSRIHSRKDHKMQKTATYVA